MSHHWLNIFLSALVSNESIYIFAAALKKQLLFEIVLEVRINGSIEFKDTAVIKNLDDFFVIIQCIYNFGVPKIRLRESSLMDCN